jgi:hypothetical protein
MHAEPTVLSGAFGSPLKGKRKLPLAGQGKPVVKGALTFRVTRFIVKSNV